MGAAMKTPRIVAGTYEVDGCGCTPGSSTTASAQTAGPSAPAGLATAVAAPAAAEAQRPPAHRLNARQARRLFAPLMSPESSTGLRVLRLTRLGLTQLPGPAFSSLAVLEELDLGYNCLAELPPEVFSLPRLRTLAAPFNSLDKLSRRVRALVALESLDVRSNRLRELPLAQLMSLPRIRYVGFGDNYVPSVGWCRGDQQQKQFVNAVCAGAAQQVTPDLVDELGVYVGCAASTRDAEELRRLGITHILSVGVAPQTSPEDLEKFQTLRLTLADIPSEDITSLLDGAIEFISSAVTAGNRCLVHCVAGMSRSAAVAVAWVAVHRRIGYDKAHDQARASRPAICINLGFEAQVRKWVRARLGPDCPPSVEKPLASTDSYM
eukprot:m51a1_g5709 putative leucine rich repeat and phosphatase domain containing protein (379) ;mRNA; f:1080716-1081940